MSTLPKKVKENVGGTFWIVSLQDFSSCINICNYQLNTTLGMHSRDIIVYHQKLQIHNEDTKVSAK